MAPEALPNHRDGGSSLRPPQEPRATAPTAPTTHMPACRTLCPPDRVFHVTRRALKAIPASRGTKEKLETPERT